MESKMIYTVKMVRKMSASKISEQFEVTEEEASILFEIYRKNAELEDKLSEFLGVLNTNKTRNEIANSIVDGILEFHGINNE